VKSVLSLLLLLFLARPDSSLARIALESRLDADNAMRRAFLGRVEGVLARTEQRIQAVFGITADGKVIIERSDESFDFKLTGPAPSSSAGSAGNLRINSRVVLNYPIEDLQIAVARNLYLMFWPKFRKSLGTDNVLAERMYVEGMTAYAAELLWPGYSRWKYAGLYGKEGIGRYRQYLLTESNLAADVLRALSSETAKDPADRLLDPSKAANPSDLFAGRLLSYRVMKTFERDMDPKMVQLMDFAEFRQRLPRALDVIIKGFDKREQ
jgi:hypothetical protein